MRPSITKRWTRTLLTLAMASGLACPSQLAYAAPAEAPAEDPAANDPVEKAIQKAVKFLYSQQNKDGHWEATPRRMGVDHANLQWGGITSMAVYGLLAADENPQNDKLSKALAFLDGTPDVIGTYAMGMKLQRWNYIKKPTAAQIKILKAEAVLQMGGVNLTGATAGLYHYSTTPDQTYDISTSNYGVLGMWAAAQQNLEIPKAYWELVDKAWRNQQNKDGGWQYTGGGPNGAGQSTYPLTAAGVATLFITQDMLNFNKGECKGNLTDDAIERGLKWMSDNTNVGQFGNLYATYNVERVGTASGYKYFGTVDWYKAGAEHLIKSQAADGSWSGGHGGAVPGTVWGLVFLVKGRAPVMMNKLEYAINLNGDKGKQVWNQRPRDLANLARHAGKVLEKELNWQIVNLKVDIEDLHDAPILYIAGNQLINFTKEEKAKLKQYVEGGGMILGHADCNDQRFTTSFQKLGNELFPYEFRELSPDHQIYNEHFRLAPPGVKPPVLKGMSNGARELMLLIPTGDPARMWQIQNFSGQGPKTMTELATNIYLYAADKNTLKGKFKGQGYIVDRNDKAAAGKSIKVARLEYSGTWNPEPGGWRRLSNLMHNTRATDLEVVPVKLGDGKLTNDFKVAHMTGAFKFSLNAAQQKEIKDFIAGGGTLVLDSCGGGTDFAAAAEVQLKAMFPGDADKGLRGVLPVSHGVYASGAKIELPLYRAFAKHALGSETRTPRLRGIDVNGRTAVIYSPEDLSVGLVGMTIDGVNGYTPDMASKLMGNILTFAASGGGGGNNVAVGAAQAPAGVAPAVAPPAAGEQPAEKMKDDKMEETTAKKPAAKPAAPAPKTTAKR